MNDCFCPTKNGFECEFVTPPPDALDHDCPICKRILREPHQAICCGTSSCKDCIKAVISEGKPCPSCEEELTESKVFPNVSLKKRLYSLAVYCIHKGEGCEWTGELGQIDQHLNCNPPVENLLMGCPHTVIHCPFVYAGCGVTLSRKDMNSHLNDTFISHQLMQAARQSSLLNTVQVLQQENQSLKKENSLLQETVDKQQSFLQYREQQIVEMEVKIENMEKQQEMASRTGMAIGPVRFSMDGFEQHKQTSEDNWFSPHFWTHPQGYKVCLCIIANGEGPAQGHYTSVLIHMMKGEFDDQLKWPFRGIITVQLLDQEGGEDHWSQEVHITNRTPDEVADRVIKGQRTKKGWGLFQFIPHAKLEPKYLNNDSLCFQIGQIQIK